MNTPPVSSPLPFSSKVVDEGLNHARDRERFLVDVHRVPLLLRRGGRDGTDAGDADLFRQALIAHYLPKINHRRGACKGDDVDPAGIEQGLQVLFPAFRAHRPVRGDDGDLVAGSSEPVGERRRSDVGLGDQHTLR